MSYNFKIDSSQVKYQVQKGESLSGFLTEYAKNSGYKIKENAVNNLNWNAALDKLGKSLGLIDVNYIKSGDEFGIPKQILEETISMLGMERETTQQNPNEPKYIPQAYQTKQESSLIKTQYALTDTSIADESKWTSWNKIKEDYNTVNNLNNQEMIVKHHQNKNDGSNYVVVDKKKCLLKVYSATGKVLKQIEVGLGAQKGDDYLTKDKKMTTAGIYTVTRQGNGHDEYSKKYGKNIFLMETDRGASGVAIHQIPNGNTSRRPKHNNGNLEDNRYSNGCINLKPEEHVELQKFVSKGTKVYVLPEDNNNRFVVKNGEINLFQEKYTGKVLTSKRSQSYYPLKIEFTGKRNPSDSSSEFSSALMSKKSDLMEKLGIDNDTYNDLAQLSLGIAGQETNFGNSWRYALKSEALVSTVKKISGDNSYNSKGMTQIKIEGITDPKAKKLLKDYGITKDTLSQPKKSALATMIILSCMYKNELPALKDEIKSTKISNTDALLYLWCGKKHEIKNKTATPEKSIYINSVKSYYKQFTLKQGSN